MSNPINALGQPIGFAVDDWQPAGHPRDACMRGGLCTLERLQADAHTPALWQAFGLDVDSANWTYLPYGPFDSQAGLHDWIASACQGDDPCFFAVIDRQSGDAVGVASFLRIDPPVGVIEVGHIHFSQLMQQRPISTEAMFLMMNLVFDELGYRRYEWKCDALNAPSRRAAERLGFCHEGVFRQATLYKNRNRDTAWFSIIDREWPAAKAVFEAWLDPANFDTEGRQLRSLSVSMKNALAGQRSDPGQ